VATATQFEKLKTVHALWPAAALAGIVALALGLGLHLLGLKSFWLDEGVSASVAQLPWSDFFKLLWRREANMGLYYLLLRGWIHLGESEFTLRLLSVIFAVAAVVAVYVLGRRLFDRNTGLLAALLLALNAFHLRYAQEARSYSLLILLVTLSTYCFVLLLENPSRKRRVLYITISVLAFYSHFFALFVIVAQWIALVLWKREPRAKSQLVSSAVWIAALCFPGIVFLLLKNHGQLDWIPAPTFRSIYDSVALFTGQAGPGLLIIYAVLCGFAIIKASHSEPWPRQLLATWLVLPIALLLAISVVKPLFVPRYAAMCLPALVLLAAAGLRELKVYWRSAATIVLVVFSLFGIRNYYAGLPAENQGWRELTRFVVANSVAGDQVIFENGIQRPVFEYYRGNSKWPQVLFPSHGEQFTYRDFEGYATAQVAESAEQHWRVWLIHSDSNAPELQAALAARFRELQAKRFPAATARIYLRRPK